MDDDMNSYDVRLSDRTLLYAALWGTHPSLFLERRFGQTFSSPLDWPWFIDISGTINMVTTYHPGQFRVGSIKGRVTARCCTTDEEFLRSVEDPFRAITTQSLRP